MNVNSIIAVGIAGVLLLIVVFGFLIGITGIGNRSGRPNDTPPGQSASTTSGGVGVVVGTRPSSCTGPAGAQPFLNANGRNLFKEAADSYLGGDQAMLLALVQQESAYNRFSISSSFATGLAQFLHSTAKGKVEFAGGTDPKGKTWPAGTLYERPSQSNTPDEARFDAERSLYGGARYLGQFLPQKAVGGDLYNAYFYGYHGGGNLKERNPAAYEEGKKGAAALVDKYQKIRAQYCS